MLACFTCLLAVLSFRNNVPTNAYQDLYLARIKSFENNQESLLQDIAHWSPTDTLASDKIRKSIHENRTSLKSLDFWLRYLNPISYKQINGPLPVEWETEVFEKFEKPYKRPGAGLTLAELYLDETNVQPDSLTQLISLSKEALHGYLVDSITQHLNSPDHFYLCNRLFLLNLATLYTSGFECPNPERIIPELNNLLLEVEGIYKAFNQSYPLQALPQSYLSAYREAILFVKNQPLRHEGFEHFTFIRDHVNPLFRLNQQLLREYHVRSKSYVDYSLNTFATSIFSKNLYRGQYAKGIYARVTKSEDLEALEQLGRMLFYDPLLSGNNMRSCASCHAPSTYFCDTSGKTSKQFDGQSFLPRNSPSLLNASFNHLLTADGIHSTLQEQGKAVILNPKEMRGNEKELMEKIKSCKTYSQGFKRLLVYTPQEKEISLSHVVSALTYYYDQFSRYEAPFDRAMNHTQEVDASVKRGFNVFMSKAQCATCHFAPQFNGVKPPYVGSEFEVLGVPADTLYRKLSADSGQYAVNPATEMLRAFRTGTLRNCEKTKPYMHNGVFSDLKQVIDFYDAGGGVGHGLKVDNQTLSGDSLHLSANEKLDLLWFLKSLTEDIPFEPAPQELPQSKHKYLNTRKVGGEY